MLTSYLIMRPEQPHETCGVDLPEDPGHDALRDIIKPILDGCPLEHVSVFADFAGGTNYQRLDMFVDELGILKGLETNEAATLIYRRANQMGLSGSPRAADPDDLPYIAGAAVLFSRRVWF